MSKSQRGGGHPKGFHLTPFKSYIFFTKKPETPQTLKKKKPGNGLLSTAIYFLNAPFVLHYLPTLPIFALLFWLSNGKMLLYMFGIIGIDCALRHNPGVDCALRHNPEQIAEHKLHHLKSSEAISEAIICGISTVLRKLCIPVQHSKERDSLAWKV